MNRWRRSFAELLIDELRYGEASALELRERLLRRKDLTFLHRMCLLCAPHHDLWILADDGVLLSRQVRVCGSRFTRILYRLPNGGAL